MLYAGGTAVTVMRMLYAGEGNSGASHTHALCRQNRHCVLELASGAHVVRMLYAGITPACEERRSSACAERGAGWVVSMAVWNLWNIKPSGPGQGGAGDSVWKHRPGADSGGGLKC
ncbi:hypothetical protein chiPu_0018577 [Chiloscyllium punctatum]|uniref:Uncharacterized protein n=1 Tax=Chiloscyllium punctatum TaxID=137246 RepID=A0A401RP28_CHIPU|nr:hypothetical protein [Chiloscyllium punctatum]